MKVIPIQVREVMDAFASVVQTSQAAMANEVDRIGPDATVTAQEEKAQTTSMSPSER